MPRTWGTWSVVILCCAVYVGMVVAGASPLSPDVQALLRWGADYGPLTIAGEPWRLVTSGFVHIGLDHLAVNLWCLWTAGMMVERWFGLGGFAAIYLFSLAMSSLVSIAWDPGVVSAGASGAVFGVFGALYAGMRALERAAPPQVFEDLRLVAGLFLIHSVLYGFANPFIDNAAHVGGLIAGIVGAGLLGRAYGDSELRMPLLRLDLRFALVLLALIAGGWAVASYRVRTSEAVVGYFAEQIAQAAEVDDRSAALESVDALLATAILDDRDGAYWWAFRGDLLLELERWDEALQAADRSLDLDPDVAHVHHSRSIALSELERFDEAAAAAERLVAMDPGLPDAFHQWLWCLSHLDRDEELLRVAEQAVSAHADKPVLQYYLAFALERAGRLQEAMTAVQRALEQSPEDPWSAELRDRIQAGLDGG